MSLFGSSVELTLSVAVPRPLTGLFTYRISSELASRVRIGGSVQVPFGRSVTRAFVVEDPRPLSTVSLGIPKDQLKDVLEVGDEDSVLPEDVMALCKWAHEYYFVPLGEVLNCASPLLKKPKEGARRRQPSKKPRKLPSKPPIQLNSAQEEAVTRFDEMRIRSPGAIGLLQGVTGSGKTEVYIELAKRTLSEGKGVILLVPEIALTPQLHGRFEEGLGAQVGLWHSAVSLGKRRAQVEALRKGDLKIVVGARSAVFAPVRSLGLIVVDEEHDPTYKQEDRVRYHARDLAVVRGKQTGALVVLGSATPSLESRERVKEGRYSLATLDRRIGYTPRVEMIDLASEEKVEKTQAVLAKKTFDALQETLTSGEQAMVFLNRRGFAAFLLCKDCGEVKNCPNCSVSLTLHKKRNHLRCHYCGQTEAIPDTCGKCQSSELQAMGAGTESLEVEFPALFPNARIARLDRDQVTSTTRLESVLDSFRNREIDVLLGTQMLVKGHDFPGVTLVVVMLADSLFRWPDFRAAERAYQVLKQVAGRAGRGQKPGRVLIQTFDPANPVLDVISGQMAEGDFLDAERQLRQALGYPPFGRLARLRFESSVRDEAIARAKRVAEVLRHSPLQVLGPSEAFLERVNGIFRWDLLLKAPNIQILQRALFQARETCFQSKWPFLADTDPYGI